jgi:rhamnogalacturonan endolyase
MTNSIYLAWLGPLVLLLLCTVLHAQQTLTFESEDISTPASAWQENVNSDNLWNLWSTDVNAIDKWSGGGVVLQSPPVLQDRSSPEEGAPVLHSVIDGLDPGEYQVSIKYGRALAASLDGQNWINLAEVNGSLGSFNVSDGSIEFWIDDLYADMDGPGSSYYDCVYLTSRNTKPQVNGWASERVREDMDRGIVSIKNSDGSVYIGWRLLYADPDNITFDVYRRSGSGNPVKLNSQPVAQTTDYVDADPPSGVDIAYWVQPLSDGLELSPSKETVVVDGQQARQYISIALDGDYTFQKVAIADVTGDGSYDYIIKQPNFNTDPYQQPGYWKPSEDTYKVEAYSSQGEFLWRHDMGWSIEEGIWYSPYIVYDFDGDGKAEVAIKAGEGDPRTGEGQVMEGPEYLFILDGMTGNEITRTDWPSRDGFPSYNYYSRNQLGVAYLDGRTPCILVARGTYNVMKLTAYQFHNGELEQLWYWENTEETDNYHGQGAHFMHVADVDNDGRDEVILGSSVIDDNGTGLWTTGLGHPDHCYLGDIDPSRPGLEIYYGIEPGRSSNAVCLVDAATGSIIWGIDESTSHVHSTGLCADMDPSHAGIECYSGERDYPTRWLHAADGTLIGDESDYDWGLAPRAVYWDADLQKEILRGSNIYNFPDNQIASGIDGRQAIWADILGDWREEIVTSVNGELRIYTTSIPASDRRTTLMQDPIYRIDIAHGSMGYTQPPMTTNCLSDPQYTSVFRGPVHPAFMNSCDCFRFRQSPGGVVLSVTADADGTVRLSNMRGSTAGLWPLAAGKNEYLLSRLPPGMYFTTIRFGGRYFVVKTPFIR